MQTRGISTQQMFDCLVEHGCHDMHSAMDPDSYSSGAVATGGFGDIWKGKLFDGTNVAIKMWRITSPIQGSEKSVKRGMRELYNWSKMDHQNVHKLLGVVIFQGRLGMVSPWMEYGNIQDYLQKSPGADHYQMCLQVVTGVQYLHSEDIVHGDIKASNILVSQDGVAKLTDFDHSIMCNCDVFTNTTRIGGGTPRWMAPELILETSYQRSKTTDVYALGMTLLEIITGNFPYYPECRNDAQVITKLMRRVIPDRTEHFNRNKSGDQLWELLVRCWDHDPAARPTACEMLSSLQCLTSHDITFFELGDKSTFDMIECLIGHGCPDMTTLVDPNQCSSSPVASGSFGDIWKGRLRDGTNIAIKSWRMNRVIETPEKNAKRAMRELYHWSKMEHRNVHKLLGAMAFQERLGMVSQWMENGNLQEYICRYQNVDRHRLCMEVSSGVRYLHGSNMVHGDLKTYNILVSSEGIPKISGFNVSVLSDCSLVFTETDRKEGSLRWMAPELIIETSCRKSPMTDMYALGMTLYEIITGNRPYDPECRTDMLVLSRIMDKLPPNRTKRFDQHRWASEMWEILGYCWSHDPDSRPTAGQMVEWLKSLDDEAIELAIV